MKKILACLLTAALIIAFAISAFALTSPEKESKVTGLVIKDADGNEVVVTADEIARYLVINNYSDADEGSDLYEVAQRLSSDGALENEVGDELKGYTLLDLIKITLAEGTSFASNDTAAKASAFSVMSLGTASSASAGKTYGIASGGFTFIDTLTSNNNTVIESIKLTVSVPGIKADDTVKVLHLNGDKWEVIDAEVTGDETVVFTATSEGIYGFAVKEEPKSPQTGDCFIETMFALTIGVVVTLSFAVYFYKRYINEVRAK